MKTRTIIALSMGLTVVGIVTPKYLAPHQERGVPESPQPASLVAEKEMDSSRNALETADIPEVKAPGAAAEGASAHRKVWEEYPRASDLKKYARLSEKALLLEPDKIVKRRLLADEDFLKGLETLLKTPPVDQESIRAQNTALDFVLEALNTDLRAVAVEVLRNVVADPAVENHSMTAQDRQVLAGIKAEALFNWSAVDTEAAMEIPGLLPGQVSEKIWENVQKQQENNLAESAALAEAR